MRSPFASAMLAALISVMLVPTAAAECVVIDCLADGDVEGAQEGVQESTRVFQGALLNISAAVVEFGEGAPDLVLGAVNSTMVFLFGDIWTDPDGWAVMLVTTWAPETADSIVQNTTAYAVLVVDEANETAHWLVDITVDTAEAAARIAMLFVDFLETHGSGIADFATGVVEREADFLTGIAMDWATWAEGVAEDWAAWGPYVADYAVALVQDEAEFLLNQTGGP